MQLHALGVDSEKSQKVLRFCVLSTVMLSCELKTLGMNYEDRQRLTDNMWDKLTSMKGLKTVNKFRYATDTEQELMADVNDPTGQMWLWVASLLGRMSQDGDIPAPNTPTYGRIMNLCQVSQESVRHIRFTRHVKVPFLYVHTLATLVHLTNFVFAVALGLTWGTSWGGIQAYARTFYASNPNPKDATIKMPTEHVQAIITETLKCVLAPVLYHMFFLMGCEIMSPFQSEAACIPVQKLLNKLNQDLADAERLAKNPPCWVMPKFLR